MSLNKWEKPHYFWFITIVSRLKSDIWVISSLLLVIALLILCFTAQYLVPFSDGFCGSFMMPPSWSKTGDITFILGTDDLGRDIFSRLLLGFRPTFGSALLITLLVVIISSLLALMSFFYNCLFEIIKIILNCLFIIPSFLLAISFALLLGNDQVNIILSVTLSLIPYFTMGLSYLFKTELRKEYIIATQLDGASQSAILFGAVLPNIISQASYNLVRIFTFAILHITILNFLELGISPNSNDWGSLMREYRWMIKINPWGFISAGLTLSICILSMYLLNATLSRIFRVT